MIENGTELDREVHLYLKRESTPEYRVVPPFKINGTFLCSVVAAKLSPFGIKYPLNCTAIF